MSARKRSERRSPGWWTAPLLALATGLLPAVSIAHIHAEGEVAARTASPGEQGPPGATALCPACRAAQQHAQLPFEPAQAARPLESSGTLSAETEVGRPDPRHHRESPRAPPAGIAASAA